MWFDDVYVIAYNMKFALLVSKTFQSLFLMIFINEALQYSLVLYQQHSNTIKHMFYYEFQSEMLYNRSDFKTFYFRISSETADQDVTISFCWEK